MALTPPFLRSKGITEMPATGVHTVTVPGVAAGWDMLARRFTIVCLVIMLFGMMLSSLVARSSHPTRAWDASICIFDRVFACAPSKTR